MVFRSLICCTLLELTREKKKKAPTLLTLHLSHWLQGEIRYNFFSHYLGIPICWMFKRKSTGKLNFNGVWISRWQTNWGREWVHGQKIPNNSNCVHTTWHTPHKRTHSHSRCENPDEIFFDISLIRHIFIWVAPSWMIRRFFGAVHWVKHFIILCWTIFWFFRCQCQSH